MEKENSDINEIILHQNTIQDKSLSEKIEIKIQKKYRISIPSIILEIVNTSSEQPSELELENLKNFFNNNFGEVLNIVILEKRAIVLFKTFFIAMIVKKFFEKENQVKDDKKPYIKVRWFDFEKDNNLLSREDVKCLFGTIFIKYIGNIRPEMKELNNNLYKNVSPNNNIGIKMNMNMNINNFNINASMNPLGQAQNMANLQQYLQLQQLMKMNNKNMNFQNINPHFLIQLAQIQNNIAKNGGLNLLINKQNNNTVNDINNQKIMNNPINAGNNNINLLNNPLLINNNMQLLSQMNPQLLQTQLKNMSLMPNTNNNNNHSDINMMNNKNQASQPNINYNTRSSNNSNNNSNNNNYNDEKNFGKYTCKYEILIANDKEFQIARRLIGSKGCNMKNIINQCKSKPDDSDNVKLRLRGKGSGYKEGPDYKESDEPLHLCISSKNPEDMKKACLLVDDLLNKVHKDYKEYCEKFNVTPENTEIAMRIESKNLGYNGK